MEIIYNTLIVLSAIGAGSIFFLVLLYALAIKNMDTDNSHKREEQL